MSEDSLFEGMPMAEMTLKRYATNSLGEVRNKIISIPLVHHA